MIFQPFLSSCVRRLASSTPFLGILLLECLVAAAQNPGQALLPTPPHQTSHPGDISAIQHIVFIIKENRTFDHYFGTYPGANGATTAVISTGQTLPLLHAPDPPPRDISHGWFDAIQAGDAGKMDLFDIISGANQNGDLLGLSQLTQSDIPNYFNYAQHFVLADNMFSSIQGASFVNHLYTVGAQSSDFFSQPTPSQPNGGSCELDSGYLRVRLERRQYRDPVVPLRGFYDAGR